MPNLKNLFTETIFEESQVKITDFIKKLTSIEISDDGLPTNLCTLCIEDINNIYKFARKCIVNDCKLKLQNNYLNQLQKAITENDYQDPIELNLLKNTAVHVEDIPIKLETAESLPNEKVINPLSLYQEDPLNDDLCVVKYEEIIGKSVEESFSNFSAKNSPKSNDDFASFEQEDTSRDDTVHFNENSAFDAKQQEEYLNCVVCGTSFENKGQLRIHEKEHMFLEVFRCRECPREFPRLKSLRAHFKYHVQPTIYKCTECNEVFEKYHLLKWHRASKKHYADCYKFQCPKCPKKTTSEACLKLHMEVHEKRICKKCNKEFSSANALLDHEKLYEGKRDFACPVCNKTFAHAKTLKCHIKRHQNNTSYKCKECGARFQNQKQLLKHEHQPHANLKSRMHRKFAMKIKHPFKCDVCEEVLPSKATYKVHMRWHTGEKQFICDICKKCYVNACALKRHKVTHDEERPHFSCQICNKSYVDRSALSKHMEVHY